MSTQTAKKTTKKTTATKPRKRQKKDEEDDNNDDDNQPEEKAIVGVGDDQTPMQVSSAPASAKEKGVDAIREGSKRHNRPWHPREVAGYNQFQQLLRGP